MIRFHVPQMQHPTFHPEILTCLVLASLHVLVSALRANLHVLASALRMSTCVILVMAWAYNVYTVQLNSNLTLEYRDSRVFTDFFRVTHQHSRVFRVCFVCLVTAR